MITERFGPKEIKQGTAGGDIPALLKELRM